MPTQTVAVHPVAFERQGRDRGQIFYGWEAASTCHDQLRFVQLQVPVEALQAAH